MLQHKVLSIILLLIVLTSIEAAKEKSEKFQKLLKTTKEKKTGILEFSGETLDKYAKSSRDFSLVVLITAEKNSKVQCEVCPHVNNEFQRTVDQFKEELGYSGYSADKFSDRPVFFGRCDIQSCMDFYKSGNYRGFPVLLHIRPSKDEVSSVDYRKVDRVDEIYQDPSAETMTVHISRLTGHNFVREIPMWKMVVQGGAALIVVLVLIKLLYDKIRTFGYNSMVGFALSVCVFAFVMAGTIFNAIHNPGMFYRNPASKQLMLIYPSTRHQFVVEGIIMATLFTLGGLFFVGFTSHVPSFKDAWKQRGMFMVCACGFFTCLFYTMTIFKVKHGYYPYWF